MIVIALGANLPSPQYGSPVDTLEAALQIIGADQVRIVARSSWYKSAPVPASDQPDYVNGVILVHTALTAQALLDFLHGVERAFGRTRSVRNEARLLDLDLIDYEGQVRDGPGAPVLPHPRMHQRAFVLLPLAEIAPDWVHPVTGRNISSLLDDLPRDAVGEGGTVRLGGE